MKPHFTRFESPIDGTERWACELRSGDPEATYIGAGGSMPLAYANLQFMLPDVSLERREQAWIA